MTSLEQQPKPETIDQIGELAKRETSELDKAARMGTWLAAAESGSKDPKALAMGAALRMMYVQSLGLPAHAASEVYVIKGNLTLSAKLCRALAHNHGISVVKADETDESVTAVVMEGSKELGRYTFTLDMAARAGLSGDNWTRNPDRMKWARASKRALDDYAPWVTVGITAVEETDGAPEPFDSDEVLEGEVVSE